MKNYFKIIITFFLLILLYITIDVGFNYNQEKQFFNDKNSVTINLFRNKRTYNKFIDYINDFSRKNDVIITKQIYANHNKQVFSSNPTFKVANKPFAWSPNQWISTYDSTELASIGHSGFYHFSKDGLQKDFCTGVVDEGLGKCAIDTTARPNILTFIGNNYWAMLATMAITVFGMYGYLLSNDKKEVSLRKISGESRKKIFWRMFDDKLFYYFIINVIIMSVLLLINNLITNNVGAFLNMLFYYLGTILLVFVLLLLLRWFMFRFYYKNTKNRNVSASYNKREYKFFATIFNVLKFLLMALLIVVGTKQLNTFNEFRQTEKGAKVFKDHQEIYTFDVDYKGQLPGVNAKMFDKRASGFYKSLSNRNKLYLVDASRAIDSKFNEPDCKALYNYSCNGVFVNQNYLNDFTDLSVGNSNTLNVFVKKQKKVDTDELIKDIRKNMDLDGAKRRYSIHYYDDNIKLLTLDERAYEVKNPVILVDNMGYRNQMYGSIAARGHNMFFETNSDKPFGYIRNYVQSNRLENEILGVYKPFSRITEKQRALDDRMEQTFAVIVLGLLALMTIIYDHIKLLFDRDHDKITLNTIHGLPLYYLLKGFYIFNIIFAVIVVILALIFHLNVFVAITVALVTLVITYVMSEILKNKNVKGDLK